MRRSVAAFLGLVSCLSVLPSAPAADEPAAEEVAHGVGDLEVNRNPRLLLKKELDVVVEPRDVPGAPTLRPPPEEKVSEQRLLVLLVLVRVD